MPNLEEYTIGWICAINTEFVAARAFLDESHGKPEGAAQNDDNHYALGRMRKHNVVIAVLPKGEYGTTTAATVARNMVHSFPNVRIGLMVGIAGGAPSEKHDIRLGDIVVSSRGGGLGGVFQYDYGKTLQNGSFVETGSLNQPPQVLLAAVNGLEADYAMDGHQLDSKVEEALERYPRLRKSHSRPPALNDRLYRSNVTHPSGSISDCLQVCSDDAAQMVLRHERGEYDENPAIYFGLIASGNQIIKDAHTRDKLAAEKEVLCFETEAAAYDYITKDFGMDALQFFFDFGDERKQTVDNMLRGLIFQLYTLQAKPTSELDDLFKHHNDGRDQPHGRALSDCLQKMLQGSRITFIFVDALDECSERVNLLKWVEGFMAVPSLDHVQLIMAGKGVNEM
ncbi:nacht and ankyrin domain protein [Colletotrichum kahawae]|uniref:Nacht and ankyrin domain protein n=1 Tax=Colletotrichum kahawae TaxID=34407 RepID=A0AAE0DAC8_COLKA|nr:nacht and ankyrin domain protein [Colletotrichum kahawae]